MEHLDNNTRKNAHEATALLTPSTEATGVQTDTPPSPRTRCSWPWTHVVALCAAIVITANVAGYLSKAPKIRLFESVLCNEHWLSEEPSVVRDDGSVPEALCKIDVVQDRLATILGWQLFFDSIPAILLPIPYGYLADKYGRKWILVAAIFGVAASFASILFVVGILKLPLQYVWLSSLFALVGGGATVATALLMTIVADVVPADKRSSAFFYLLTCELIDECLIPPLTAILMRKSPWIPLVAGVGILVLSTMMTMALPETLPVQYTALEIVEIEQGSMFEGNHKNRTWTDWLVQFKDSFAFATRKASVAALILIFLISELGLQSFDLLLQYVSKRYGWSLSEAGLLLSLRAAVNVVLFIIVLPLIGTLAFLRTSTVSKDLWTARASIILLILGAFILFMSVTPVVMIIGVIVYTFGTGFRVALRSLVTTIVETEHESQTSDIGRLYALISLMEGVGTLIAGPGMAWTFRLGIKLGQAWLGLPFALATLLFILISPVMFMIRA